MARDRKVGKKMIALTMHIDSDAVKGHDLPNEYHSDSQIRRGIRTAATDSK